MRIPATVAMATGVLIALGAFAAYAADSAAPSTGTGGQAASGTPATPAAAEAAPTADVVAVLDKMDDAGKDLKTVRCKFDYEMNQTLYEKIQKRKGELVYLAPNQIRFEFVDKPLEAYVFDGRTLFNRKDATHQLIIYELRKPDEKPVESLELGKTPFPLPFGQKKENVLKHFTVTRDAAEEAADKEKRAVLVLTPKAGTALAKDYTKILLWVDAKTSLPTRAKLYDQSENETTVDFRDIETNKPVDAKAFLRPDVPQDWEIVNHAKGE
jgi:outer membrane lipoprotein-sorting protein